MIYTCSKLDVTPDLTVQHTESIIC